MTRSKRQRRIRAAVKPPQKIIAMSAPVTITAAETVDGKPQGPAKFQAEFYTGGQMQVAGWNLPVVVDLAGMQEGKVLVANLDHNESQRVGNFAVANDGKTAFANGTATARTPARDEVIGSAEDGYQWQASIEANPTEIEEVKAGKPAEANGQTFEGPIYIARKSQLKGFAFVSHGADDNTSVSIAATADKLKEKSTVDTKLKAWIEEIGFDSDDLTEDQLAGLTASFEGNETPKPKPAAHGDPFEARKIEAKRRREIRDHADRHIERSNSSEEEIIAIEQMCDHAIDANMSIDKFRIEMYEAAVPMGTVVHSPKRGNKELNGRILEAAVCQTARMPGIEDHFDDRTLQAAHDQFKGRIGLKQLFLLGAQANGHNNDFSNTVTAETLRAAFSPGQHGIRGGGFSTLSIPTVVSNTANKFIMRGWNSVNQASLEIAKIQNVNDFKTITTVSLTDNVIYEKVGSDGQIKHGELGEITYSNKADTYARMLAITRQQIINDDLGALSDAPMKLGIGAMKKLNDIFWTEFLGLVGASFFASGNNNINTGVAEMTSAGLSATEVIFMAQTNPDGTPLGAEPEMLVVPTALKTAANNLMDAEKTKGDTDGPDGNPWRGRFSVVSAPYISNSSYTGNTAVGWWMLGNKETLPVIAIAALFGQVTPTVDTAEADFNVLGVQMRGYSDVGVADQEYRGGVYADGGSS